MATSSTTPNYHLPQWADSDRPAIREDLNSAFSTIDTALNDVDSAVQQDAANILGLANRVSAAETTVESYGDDIEELGEDFNEISSTITSHTNSINSLTTQTSQNTSAISSLDTRMGSAEGSISSNTNSINSLNSTVSDNSDGIIENAADIQAIESNLNAFGINNTADATAKKNLINQHTTTLQNHTNQINTLTSDNSTQQDAINALRNSVNVLIDQFNLTDVTDATISGNVNTLKLVQNESGTIYKMYGAWVNTNSPQSRVDIPGLINGVQYKGFDTGLNLNSVPNEAYIVSQAGYVYKTSDHTFYGGIEFAVGNDGAIYLAPRTTATGGYVDSTYGLVYPPILYINSTFDDVVD